MSTVKWTQVNPNMGPRYHVGRIGKVKLYSIKSAMVPTHDRHGTEMPYILRSTLGEYQGKYGSDENVLMRAAEDEANKLLTDMGVTPFE